MAANLTTKLGQLVDVLTPDTTNTRIGVANASPTRTLDVTGTGAFSGLLTANGGVKVTTTSATTDSFTNIDTNTGGKEWRFGATTISGGYFSFYNATDAVFGPKFSSTGLVGIGMTPSNVLDITQNQNGASVIKLLNNSAGANAQALVQLSDGTNNAYMVFFGTGGVGTGPNNPGSFSIQTQATGGMNIATTAAYPMKFHINSTERARIDTSGNLLVGTTTSVGSLSNTAIMSAGRHSTFTGTASIPNGGSTVTLTTLVAGGTYLVGWQLGEAAGIGVWISGGGNLSPQQGTISSGNYYTATLTVSFTVAGFSYSPSTSTNCVFTCGNSTGGSATLDYVFTRLR